MFDSLSDRLNAVLDRLTRRGALSEADVDAALREVRRALLEADVALDVARAFTDACPGSSPSAGSLSNTDARASPLTDSRPGPGPLARPDSGAERRRSGERHGQHPDRAQPDQ